MTKWYDRSRPTTAGPRRRAVLAGGVAGTLAAALGIGTAAQARRGASSAKARHGAAPAKALPLGFAPNIVFLLTVDGPRNSYGIAENAFPVVANRYMGHWLSYPNGSCNDPMCAPGRASTLGPRALQLPASMNSAQR